MSKTITNNNVRLNGNVLRKLTVKRITVNFRNRKGRGKSTSDLNHANGTGNFLSVIRNRNQRRLYTDLPRNLGLEIIMLFNFNRNRNNNNVMPVTPETGTTTGCRQYNKNNMTLPRNTRRNSHVTIDFDRNHAQVTRTRSPINVNPPNEAFWCGTRFNLLN